MKTLKSFFSVKEKKEASSNESVSSLDIPKNNYHKNYHTTKYIVADANWGMYDSYPNTDTEEDARAIIEKEYTNRNKGDGYDDYWRNRKQVVLKITTTQEVLG